MWKAGLVFLHQKKHVQLEIFLTHNIIIYSAFRFTKLIQTITLSNNTNQYSKLNNEYKLVKAMAKEGSANLCILLGMTSVVYITIFLYPLS